MQILAGIRLDGFGGRLVMIPVCIIVAIGCACIPIPWNSIWLSALGQFFVGFGLHLDLLA
jgi:hypothetical protein